jgi:hypothetical protein
VPYGPDDARFLTYAFWKGGLAVREDFSGRHAARSNLPEGVRLA